MASKTRALKSHHGEHHAPAPKLTTNERNHWIVDFFLLALVATWSAYYNGIWDCDESMNYFEPFHQLLFGYGLQTWEYRCVSTFPPLSAHSLRRCHPRTPINLQRAPL